jgi:hypothetical protein
MYIVLAGRGVRRHAIGMFVVTEADAATIRAVFDREGELAAAIRVTSAVPGDHRQREGTCTRSEHRRVDAAASPAAPGDAAASPQEQLTSVAGTYMAAHLPAKTSQLKALPAPL